jgi:hypothetical protein
MTFSFDPTTTPLSDVHWARAMVGDTQEATALLSDELIGDTLSRYTSRAEALPEVAAMCMAEIVREPVRVIAPDVTADYTDRLAALKPLADQWYARQERDQAGGTAAPQRTSTAARVRPVW